MKQTIFEGMASAIVTPMTPEGIDYAALGRFIDFQIDSGINALVVMGTTGENATIEYADQLEAIRFTVERAAGRVPVIAGTGTNNTQHVLHNTRNACQAGADAVLVVTPYYNKATQNGLYQHFMAVADASTVPVILYNVPGRTGCNLLPKTVARLAEHPNIAAIKEASGNISQIAKLAQLADGCIDIYSGNDDQVLPILSLGGLGVISVLSNVAPKFTHDMVMKYFDGDTKGATEDQLKALPLINALFSEVNPIPVKTAMNLMGMNVGPLRMPLCEMEEDTKAALAKEIEKFGLKLAK